MLIEKLVDIKMKTAYTLVYLTISCFRITGDSKVFWMFNYLEAVLTKAEFILIKNTVEKQ